MTNNNIKLGFNIIPIPNSSQFKIILPIDIFNEYKYNLSKLNMKIVSGNVNVDNLTNIIRNLEDKLYLKKVNNYLLLFNNLFFIHIIVVLGLIIIILAAKNIKITIPIIILCIIILFLISLTKKILEIYLNKYLKLQYLIGEQYLSDINLKLYNEESIQIIIGVNMAYLELHLLYNINTNHKISNSEIFTNKCDLNIYNTSDTTLNIL